MGMKVFALILLIINLIVFFIAVKKSKNNQFYSDVSLLLPLGIFVWGDALILAPFWVISSVIFYFLSPVNILRYFLLFYAVRSMYEVVYWISSQMAGKTYNPPLFRQFTWLKPNDAAILYQLMNMCQMILAVAVFIGTFLNGKF